MRDHRIRCCCFCDKRFEPHPRLGDHQRTCGRADCQKQRRRLNTQSWRTQHPDGDDALCRQARQRDRQAYQRRYWAATHLQRRQYHADYMRQWRARRKASPTTSVNNPYRDNQAKLPTINTYLQVIGVNNANRVITAKLLSTQELVPANPREQRESRWT
jgi:hypothetical protein